MLLADLADLPPSPEVAIIINVGTKYVATLALLSTLRYAQIPTVLIDCESTDGSFDWFKELMSEYGFYLVSAKLRQHGETLDWIFRRIRADRVLLVDSDVEILNGEMLSRMRALLESSERLYGSGYLHPGHWLERHYFSDLPIATGIGYYMARMWIPFTLLRVEPVRKALEDGITFMHELVLNDLPQFPRLSRLLWYRFGMEFFRRHRIQWLDSWRGKFNGEKPCYVSYDTGARLHEALIKIEKLEFDGVSAAVVPWSVTHFSGITRGVLNNKASDDAYKLNAAHPIIAERLHDLYGISIPSNRGA